MAKKIQRSNYRRDDFCRVLLTDTLPYEVPLPFSNSGFYQRINDGSISSLKSETNFDLLAEKKFTIPYTFQVRKDGLENRTLAVPHPQMQHQWSEFLHKYGQLITSLCGRSEFSIRHPARVASRFYDKASSLRRKSIERVVELVNQPVEPTQASSFFAYNRYNLIHKFYDSSEFHELERTFKRMRKLDISKCFPHIYTHSISWAVRDKAFAKENRTASSFDTTFDKIMRAANYDETNGILVGPEFSRIFAEIILQAIDLDIESGLNSSGLQHNKDYAIRRYVDDYFVYANTEQELDLMQTLISEKLENYKLYLNSAKTDSQSRPFMSGQTVAKIELAKILERFFDTYTLAYPDLKEAYAELQDKNHGPIHPDQFDFAPLKFVPQVEKLSSSYIRDIKISIFENATDFELVTNHFFTVLRKRTLKFLSSLRHPHVNSKSVEKIIRFISVLIEIAFFVFAMAPRSRASNQLAQICVEVKRRVEKIGGETKNAICHLVARKLSEAVGQLSQSSAVQCTECLNLLVIMKEFQSSQTVPMEVLMAIAGIGKSDESKRSSDYFTSMTLLFYIGNDLQFSELKSVLVSNIKSRVSNWNLNTAIHNSESIMLLLDFVSCPYIDEADRIEVSKLFLMKISTFRVNPRARRLLEIVRGKDWFFGWHDAIDIGAALWKKELKPAY